VVFARLSKVFIDVYRFNCMNSFNLYKFSGIFKLIFDILKTYGYDVIPCVCPLIDHGSRPMKSHEFLRLFIYKYIYFYIMSPAMSDQNMGWSDTMSDKGFRIIPVSMCM
jgi:hypothetical protein